MTSEGRKRKRSESLDAALSPAQLSTAQPEDPERPERAEQSGYTDFDRAATAQDYTDADLPATAQPYRDVDHPTTRQAYEDVDLPTTPPDIPLVHTRARSTLSLIDEPTFPLTEEPTLPLTEESYLQRSALSPAQLSLARPEPAEQPGLTAVQGYTDVDQPTTPPADSSVHTPAPPTLPLTEDPHLQPSALSPAQLSPTQLAYTDIDLPATPPALSPVNAPVRSTLPLTQANLRTLDPTMPQTSEGSTSNTKSVRVTREHLATWGHIIQDSNAEFVYADFLAKASELINSGRLSAMKPGSVEKAKRAYNMYKELNEPTFLDAFWPKLIKEEYIPNDKGRVTVVTADWLDDHVIGSKDQLFTSTCVVASTSATELEKSVRKESGSLPLPKPDILYGLRPKDWLTADQMAVIERYKRHTQVSPGLLLPWFIVEGKGLDGKVEEGVNQAARAGAVLNASWRYLDEVIGTPPITKGADDRSKVFSLAMSTTDARMSVHWAEVENGCVVKFHTHHLQSYKVYDSEQWVNLRRDVDNVLEWGAVERKNMVVALLNKLVQGGDAAHQKSKRMRDGEEVRVTKRQKKNEEAGEASVSG